MIDKQNFSGFLNGYKAQNFSNSVNTAAFHWDIIKQQLSLLSPPFDEPQLQILKGVLNKGFSVRQLQRAGEAIKSLLSTTQDSASCPITNNVKTLIYHYFEAAEATADTIALKTAMEIGELVKRRNC
jgi:hypothetical protein